MFLPHLQAQFLGRASTSSTASTKVSATVTPVTTSDASVVSLQSANSAEANSVAVESRFILLLVFSCFVLFVISSFRIGTVWCFRFRPIFCVHVFACCRCLFHWVLGRVSFYLTSSRVFFICCCRFTCRNVVAGFGFSFIYIWVGYFTMFHLFLL